MATDKVAELEAVFADMEKRMDKLEHDVRLYKIRVAELTAERDAARARLAVMAS